MESDTPRAGALGFGTMGIGIAICIARQGSDVVVVDDSGARLNQGMERAAALLVKAGSSWPARLDDRRRRARAPARLGGHLGSQRLPDRRRSHRGGAGRQSSQRSRRCRAWWLRTQ